MDYRVSLTPEEHVMLDGKCGAAKQKAIEVIVRFADALGAESLCEITKAQIFVGAHHYLDVLDSEDIDEVISALYLTSDEVVSLDQVSVFTQSDATPLDPQRWREMDVAEDRFKKDCRYRDRLYGSGMAAGDSCASYLTGFVPVMGEHYVSTESHALLFMNSLWGACTNAGSIETSICAAFCGRTPYWGLHIKENRRGTHLVTVKTNPKSVRDWDLLGYAIGEDLAPNAIPVIVGTFERPRVEHLKSLFASMATSGSVELCHIVGMTPEAPTLEQAFAGGTPEAQITIVDAQIRAARRTVSASGRDKLYFVSLGCPHYTLEQIQLVAKWFKGKKVHEDVVLRVWTAPAIKNSADRSGFTAVIEAAGGQLLTSTCPLVSETVPQVPAMAFDSMKQARYVGLSTAAKVFCGSVEECLESAVVGIWQGTNM